MERDAHALVARLIRDPGDREAWWDLAARVARGSALPDFPSPESVPRVLLALWRDEPARRELGAVLLPMLGLEDPDPDAPFDPASGMPARARRLRDGAEVCWVRAGAVRSQPPPQLPVEVPGFFIDRHPVTARRYQAFLEATGGKPPKAWPNQLHRPHRPVVHVRVDEAAAYARWAGARLPTGTEWERAARGDDDRRYPWGNAVPTPRLANFAPLDLSGDRDRTARPSHHWSRHLEEVGRHPEGASPFGVEDLAGNVFEWCYTQAGPTLAEDPGDDLPPRPHQSRGGSWMSPPQELEISTRGAYYHPFRAPWLGFRLVTPVPPPG